VAYEIFGHISKLQYNNIEKAHDNMDKIKVINIQDATHSDILNHETIVHTMI